MNTNSLNEERLAILKELEDQKIALKETLKNSLKLPKDGGMKNLGNVEIIQIKRSLFYKAKLQVLFFLYKKFNIIV